MAFELAYWPPADDTLTALENDPTSAALYDEVQTTLADLSEDPGNPLLPTLPWVTQTYGPLHMTPVGTKTGWYVVWWLLTGEGTAAETIEIIYIGPPEGGALHEL